MVRVRFAPSPTGELHLGGARTALYNYLFAKKNGGKFIIRLEDTDRERLVEGSLERILNGLAWLGIVWDEGPDIGGPYGPYIQSERLKIYQEHAKQLITNGAAYYCFCTQQRLDVLRQVQQADKQLTKYDRTCLRLTSAEIQDKLNANIPYVIRLKTPTGTTTFKDLIRGEIKVDSDSLDDSVLLKSDGFPTYHLANVVDDHLMEITHIIRGEEWLPSAPKHLLIYKGFGWEVPSFAHLPNVLNEKKAKLSKRRDGEAVWLYTYRAKGYLPQALINFLALLGWHPKDNQEVFNLIDLEKIFELERVQKAGAIFNLEKLNWFNANYIRKLPAAELDTLLKPYYQSSYEGKESIETLALTELLQDRLTTLADVTGFSHWFFNDQLQFDPALLVPKKGTSDKAAHAIKSSHNVLHGLADWTKADIQAALEVLVRPGTFSRGELLWPVRVALTGEAQSPDVFGVAFVLGKEKTLARLLQAVTILTK